MALPKILTDVEQIQSGNMTIAGTKTFSGVLIDKQGYEILGVPNTAAAHNAIYRGKDLTSTYTVDQICTKLASNDFSDLFIGDYITKTFTNPSGNSETADFVFAGFDYWLQNGNTLTQNNGYTDYPSNGITTNHHIVIVPRDAFATTSYMNSTNTTEDGYFNSYMCQTTLKAYATRLNVSSCFNGKIRTFTNWENAKMVSTYASAAGGGLTGSTAWNSTGTYWACHKLRLMTEPMVYGGTAFSSSGYDVGCGKAQLPLFSLNPRDIMSNLGKGGGRYAWWLSAVASATDFANVGHDGRAGYGSASGSYGVRPFFLIY